MHKEATHSHFGGYCPPHGLDMIGGGRTHRRSRTTFAGTSAVFMEQQDQECHEKKTNKIGGLHILQVATPNPRRFSHRKREYQSEGTQGDGISMLFSSSLSQLDTECISGSACNNSLSTATTTSSTGTNSLPPLLLRRRHTAPNLAEDEDLAAAAAAAIATVKSPKDDKPRHRSRRMRSVSPFVAPDMNTVHHGKKASGHRRDSFASLPKPSDLGLTAEDMVDMLEGRQTKFKGRRSFLGSTATISKAHHRC